ncbi:HD domain-containing phosphohydrolase [Neptuniibacter sp.]|uniref:HD domain-containing phosphohydrolase n=1 Tax=Neptuniibacter sp. TaxID=1962643 RepID=UPI0026340F5E|nr:HD domain-containing phosphohydrolase [Neptuniibacter sp.]MCP4596664.1 HD domain-containing protein [Neptuniibacter sp.]
MSAQPLPFYHSLRFQMGLAVVVLLCLLAANTLFSFNSENQRRQDYVALQSSGNIQQLFKALIKQSSQYAMDAPRDWETYFRDLGMYGQDLRNIIRGLDEMIPQLHNQPEALEQWTEYSAQIAETIGDPNEPRLEAVALWVVEHKAQLSGLSDQIGTTTHELLRQQLEQQRQVNISLLALSTLIGSITLISLHRVFSRPLRNILQRLQNLAHGELTEDEQVQSRNEMGTIYSAIDELSQNLKTTYKLTSSVNQATTIDSALCFVYEEYKQLLPIDAVCLIHQSNDRQSLVLDRIHSDGNLQLETNAEFSLQDCTLSSALQESEMLLLQQQADWDCQHSELKTYLMSSGLNSALFIPFNNQSGTLLLFASKQPTAFTEKHLQLLKNAGGQLQHAFEKTELVENLVISAVSGLSKLAESRDPETGDHLTRMSLYSMILTEELEKSGPYQHLIDSRYVRDILRFSPMHDIGKVGIADSILLKPGRLEQTERTEMELHPTIGGEVLKRCEEQLNASGHSMFKIGIEIAEGHHEKWDGSGYPNGWKAQEIPLSARIVAVADVFDALTSKRPYKEAWPIEKALKMFDEEAGKHFDPEVISAFHRSLPRILEVYERLKHV